MVVKVKEEEVKKEFMASSKVRSAKDEEGKKGAKKAKKSRCQQCGTSIEVIGFDCRCGSRFCVVHRHSAGHGCTYDYRAAGQSELRKANPKVVADKVRKI
ncbi:PREDICTED: AN1-type zinc finger protein 5-like [Rhagoletis zephyria]|uniref:AN1-type zinc finger protein 5-like n=1 Tax=Rhagoletis zephyria TaxID=28612 RepID=UPI0008115DB6|nr:PREDICTED: AN1-type zinc finger protein 5-like [Rhagoletis zephyria]